MASLAGPCKRLLLLLFFLIIRSANSHPGRTQTHLVDVFLVFLHYLITRVHAQLIASDNLKITLCVLLKRR